MKTDMKKIMMMSLVALVAMTMMSCLHIKVDGKDWTSFTGGHENNTPTQVHQVKEVTEMSPFSKVKVAGPFNVIFDQGKNNTVRVDGTTEQLEKMTIYVKDGSLYIDQRKNQSSGTFDRMVIYVSAFTINGIEIAGSSTVTAPKAIDAAEMTIEVAGSGDVTLAQMVCTQLGIEIAGSGNVTLGPIQAKNVKNEIAGSGNIYIAELTCNKVNNEIAGSGDITLYNLNVEQVKSEIAGSGNVNLRGNIGSHKEDIAGSGKVKVNE